MSTRMELTFTALVLTLLVSCQLACCQVQAFNCYTECNIAAALLPDASCQQILESTDCYNTNYDLCMLEHEVESVIVGIFSARGVCEGPPTNFNCPSFPPFEFGAPDPSPVLESADITPEYHSCRMDPAPTTMRQCSMFTYSHLRPFQGYRTGLETCTVPGKWYLINHNDLTVVVESQALPDSTLTQLTMVNITFSPSPCSGDNPLSYVATNSAPLPLTLSDGQTLDNSNSALQLKSSANNTVVSLLAVWMNTTIIVRGYGDALSVTVHIPGDMSFFSDGLCRGCPRHAYFNATKFNSQVNAHCSDANTAAVLSCFVHSELVNQYAFNEILNNTYVDYCQFDMYQKQSVDALSVMRSVGQDARLLPDVGFVPVVVVPTAPTPPSATSDPDSTSLSTVTLVKITTEPTEITTTQLVATTDNNFLNSASSLSQLNFVTALGLLLYIFATFLFR